MYTMHYAPDNASLIVRLALDHVGAPYRMSLVDRSTQAQRSPAYLAPCLRWTALYGPAPRDWFQLTDYPRLHQIAAALDNHPETRTAAAAEGLGPHPFTKPHLPHPPEGSAL